jgi:DHA1 family tetracycline resistance protein-like MFS transporter
VGLLRFRERPVRTSVTQTVQESPDTHTQTHDGPPAPVLEGARPGKGTAGLAFIFVTLLLDSLGIGLIIPVLPKLLGGFLHSEDAVAKFYGVFIALYAAMQFLFAPVFGALSDRFGRRPVLLAALLGAGFDYGLQALAPSIGWLLVGRVVAGITGASQTTASAYIADVTPPEKRGQSFGLIGAAFGLGFILGPALGGLLGAVSVRAPFWAAAGLSLANAAYGLLVLPESLPASERRPVEWKRANPVGSLLRIGRYPVIFGLLGTFLCQGLAQQVPPSTWVLFCERRFGWGEREMGFSLSYLGVLIALVQGFGTRIAIPMLGERGAAVAGFVLCALGFLLFGFATEGWMMYAVTIPFALSGVGGPALQGIISKQVGPSEQGELQGALTSVVSLTAVVGPIIASQLFAYFTGPRAPFPLPGVAFFWGAALMLLGLLLGARFLLAGGGREEPAAAVPVAAEG